MGEAFIRRSAPKTEGKCSRKSGNKSVGKIRGGKSLLRKSFNIRLGKGEGSGAEQFL